MKMRSAKIEHEKLGMPTAVRESFQSISIPGKMLPELKDKEVGDECMLCVEVKITGINSDNSGARYNLDITKIGYMDDYDNEEEDDD